MMSGTVVGIVDIVVTVISIIVTITSIILTTSVNKKHQKSNRDSAKSQVAF